MTPSHEGDIGAGLLGWRLSRSGKLVPNTADSSNESSIAIASEILRRRGIAPDGPSGIPDGGRALELAVAQSLTRSLSSARRPFRVWEEPREITDFFQYIHLRQLDQMAKASPELRMTLGTDYLIRPDVVVSLPGPLAWDSPYLHAVVSCKWTIRSDRVQNVRHEYNLMIRHRRDRLPHLVVVTAEPLPTRLASIARGTGEVDATYHIAFDDLGPSVTSLKGKISSEQVDAWEEVIELRRVRPFSELSEVIASW